jgi:hypothetical protein
LGTKKGYVLRTEAELAQQKKTWNSEVKYHTEEEMTDYFRKVRLESFLILALEKFSPIQEVREMHDYGFDITTKNRDVILGNWVHIDPLIHKDGGLQELRRCIDNSVGFLDLPPMVRDQYPLVIQVMSHF